MNAKLQSNNDPLCIVAGHLCLDIIPQLETRHAELRELEPGQLINVGAATLATGGVVSNTGLALHRLGARVRLVGKVGDDMLGRAVLGALRERDADLAHDTVVAQGESSSYTLVLSPPDVDRMFLHHAGCNDSFRSSDVPDSVFEGATHFHFGYPPLMRQMWQNDGRELETLLRRAKARGLSTSLDMTLPDAHSPAGQIDWRAWMKRVLPCVDLFLPSWDELMFMLYSNLFHTPNAPELSRQLLCKLSGELLGMGVAISVIKLGNHGLHARVTDNAARLAQMEHSAPQSSEWLGREEMATSFPVQVVGTTGAGDSSIAGFLFGLTRGFDLTQSLQIASATAAHCCEAADATSGVRSWGEIEARRANGWQQVPQTLS